jgi:hypothetical protein
VWIFRFIQIYTVCQVSINYLRIILYVYISDITVKEFFTAWYFSMSPFFFIDVCSSSCWKVFTSQNIQLEAVYKQTIRKKYIEKFDYEMWSQEDNHIPTNSLYSSIQFHTLEYNLIHDLWLKARYLIWPWIIMKKLKI